MDIKIKIIKILKLEIKKIKSNIEYLEWALKHYKKMTNCLIQPKKVIKKLQNELYYKIKKFDDLQINLLKVMNKPFSECYMCGKQFNISTVVYCENCLNKKLKLGNKYYCIVDEIKDELEKYKNHNKNIKVTQVTNILLTYILTLENKE